VWKLKREQKKFTQKRLLRRLREKSTFPLTDTFGSGVMADFVPPPHPSNALVSAIQVHNQIINLPLECGPPIETSFSLSSCNSFLDGWRGLIGPKIKVYQLTNISTLKR